MINNNIYIIKGLRGAVTGRFAAEINCLTRLKSSVSIKPRLLDKSSARIIPKPTASPWSQNLYSVIVSIA